MEDHIIKKKRGKRIFNIFLLFLLGLAYLFLTKTFIIAIPCPINIVTGLYCPGCGITRMMIFISRGELYNAFRSNIAVFLLMPIIVYIVIKYIYGYIVGKNKLGKFDTRLIYFLIVILIIFMVLRNIPYFDYLQPLV